MDIRKIASAALSQMLEAGFDDAQVRVSVQSEDELNIAHDEASLLRSTEDYQLALTGIKDSRKAATSITDLETGAVAEAVRLLAERAALAPRDEANTVSEDQRGDFVQGPQQSDLKLLTEKTRELLDWRAANTPRMHLEEGGAAHQRREDILLTSRGTELTSSIGCYQLMAMGTAAEGEKSSSLNYAGGVTNDLSKAHAVRQFGIEAMLRETEQQIETSSFGSKFVGDAILAPGAVADLLHWLLGQLGDGALIANASVYRDRVGEQIASPLLTLASRFDGPGSAPYTGDGCLAPPLEVLTAGKLNQLLPSLYGSRKTGIAQVPTGSGWTVAPGGSGLQALVGSIDKGAIINRFSMGSPGPNGDFSGVIKNSFRIEGGHRGGALAETMVSGNMAKMLSSINGVSTEILDLGHEAFPWIKVPGLHFS
ncbi:MAG: metallopeptidase TldD-related protein [Pseudomonadota bacterium]